MIETLTEQYAPFELLPTLALGRRTSYSILTNVFTKATLYFDLQEKIGKLKLGP